VRAASATLWFLDFCGRSRILDHPFWRMMVIGKKAGAKDRSGFWFFRLMFF
jgi:hypothetical protein